MSIQAQSTIQVDNERARVTEWRFAPGATTGYHRHPHDYVVVPLATGKLELIGPDGGRTVVEMGMGQSYFRNAGVEHETINAGDEEFAFIEIEFK